MASTSYPSTDGRLLPGALPDGIPADVSGPYDGILCSAVLEHFPRPDPFNAVFAIKALLRERGRLLVSVPTQRDDVVDGRDPYGRLFNRVTADELELLFERAGFQPIGRWITDDSLGRGHTWVVMLLELRTAGVSRPIDHIEAVLSTRERKTATYQLALIRALCEIALTEPRTVTFTDSGVVRVPIRAIADRWITYYWPLFTSPTFLPQMNGERQSGGHHLAFAGELERLIAEYRQLGDLSAFATGRRSGVMPGVAQRAYSALIGKLQRTIQVGPVTYAGGSLPDRLFGYDRGHVLVAASLWRELSLMGHWIQEALTLRWGELVSQLSAGEVSPGEVVARLLIRPSVERETAAARDVYLRQPDLACVWTNRPIPVGRLAVDHVIPYALWRNNDLWNLLPSHAEVNGRKGDRLPARDLLYARRDAIIGNWELTHLAYPRRFESEAGMQTGGGVDLGRLFDALVESVETTALQRACPRWVP